MSTNYTGLFNKSESANFQVGDLVVTQEVQVTGTTNSTSTDTGALIVSGGVGVAKDLYVGGNVYMDASMLITKPTGGNLFIDSNPTAITATSQNNLAIGETALDSITASSLRNTAIGRQALTVLTTGDDNTAVGYGALSVNNGANNTAIGSSALANLTGNNSVAVGDASGISVITGSNNTFLGSDTDGNATSSGQIAIGYGATTSVSNQCRIGNNTLDRIDLGTKASWQVPVASSIILGTTNTGMSGNSNTVMGIQAGDAITTAGDSVCIGYNAGTAFTVNGGNVCIGSGAFSLGTSSLNTAVGYLSGDSITTGSTNTFIGSNTDGNATSTGQIAIGYGATTSVSNQCVIGGSSLTEIVPDSAATCNLGSSTNEFSSLYLGDGTDGVVVSGSQGTIEMWRNDNIPFIDFKSSVVEDFRLRLQTALSTGSNLLNLTTVGGGNNVLVGNLDDGYNACVRLKPEYDDNNNGYTVTRHNYIALDQPNLLDTVAVTDANVFVFNAAAGTHKAVDSGTTKTSPGTVSAWVKININGTVHYIPSYTSKTS